MRQKLDIYESVLCDLCGKECDIDNEYIKVLKLQPYRGISEIDICEQCSRELVEKWEEEEENEKKIKMMVKEIETKGDRK